MSLMSMMEEFSTHQKILAQGFERAVTTEVALKGMDVEIMLNLFKSRDDPWNWFQVMQQEKPLVMKRCLPARFVTDL